MGWWSLIDHVKIMTTNVNELIKLCVEELRRAGFSSACIKRHQMHWMNGLVPYMTAKGIADYSPDIGLAYLSDLTPYHGTTHAASTKRGYRRSIMLLTDFQETGDVRMRIVELKAYPLSGPIGKVAIEMLEYLRNSKRLSEVTVKQYQKFLSGFITGLESQGIKIPNEVTLDTVVSYLSQIREIRRDRYTAIRHFCKFMHNSGYLPVDYSESIQPMRFAKKEHVPSVYTPEEIAKIDRSIDQSSQTGKRDYAIFVLASRLGLRSSDICALQWSNIDWDANKITLTQQKTKNPIELPLLKEVGEALVAYAQDARPKTDLKEIFITGSSPYRKMTNISLNGVISRIMQGSGIDLRNRKFGPHSLRHSLASNMLKNGVSLPTISGILGHQSTETTMMYIRVDKESLRECVLPVSLVPEAFYEQKGGGFFNE